MSLGPSTDLNLPAEPDVRVAKPPTPPFEKTNTITVHGYIGEMTKDHVNLHHMHDHRAYYQIPREGIKSAEPSPSKKLKDLYALEVYSKTPIRYYHATTAEMTAGTLSHAVATFNEQARSRVVAEARCPASCPPGCCNDGSCICAAGFPLAEGHADLFGLTVSTPEHPEE